MKTRDRIYEYIVGFQTEHGLSPTLDEIAAAVNISKSVVAYHIREDERLERRGMRWIAIIEEQAQTTEAEAAQ